MSASTSASVAYLWTFDGWLLSAVAGAGLAACSELGLETCSLIFKVIDGCNEAICAYHDNHCGPAMRSAAALCQQESSIVSSAELLHSSRQRHVARTAWTNGPSRTGALLACALRQVSRVEYCRSASARYAISRTETRCENASILTFKAVETQFAAPAAAAGASSAV